MNSGTEKSPQQVLQQYWGYPAFRALQPEIIQSVLEGKDTLALLPTGGGKSICFQVPGLMLPGMTIVISPLIALMKDQVEQLEKRGIQAAAIYSGIPKREIDILLDNCVYGKVKFLYVSPERLKTELFLVRAAKMDISLLVIDEAHCISQWGYDFRPPYLEIAQFKQLLPEVKLIALTATATPTVKEDIIQRMEMKDPAIFQKSFARKNLSYSLRKVENKEQKMIEILQKVKGSAVIYVRNRGKTVQTAEFLNKNNIGADYYHAGLPNIVRARKQEDWIKNKTRVMVSTNAFGMGIDKPDVRVVVHLDLPDSLEAYYQEAGRAGRDEQLAFAILLFHPNDAEDLKRKAVLSHPPIATLKRTYQSLANYHKIAIGSSKMASYDFDIEVFAQTYNFQAFEVFASIKKLEECGLIQLNESFYKPSKIMMTVDHKDLYKFQIAQEKLDPLIKGILRLYGGEIFSNFTTISEKSLSRMVKTEVPDIKKKLRFLHQSDILIYDEQHEKPQLTFLTQRQDANNLQIDERQLNERKRVILEKVDEMIGYAENVRQCRTQRFQEYFGELSFQNCGNCDVCIDRKKAAKVGQSMKSGIVQALEILQSGSNDFATLKQKMNLGDPFVLSEILRTLEENKQIRVHANGSIDLLIKNNPK